MLKQHGPLLLNWLGGKKQFFRDIVDSLRQRQSHMCVVSQSLRL